MAGKVVFYSDEGKKIERNISESHKHNCLGRYAPMHMLLWAAGEPPCPRSRDKMRSSDLSHNVWSDIYVRMSEIGGTSVLSFTVFGDKADTRFFSSDLFNKTREGISREAAYFGRIKNRPMTSGDLSDVRLQQIYAEGYKE